MSNFWDDAEETSTEFSKIPDGEYPATVEKAVVDLAHEYGPQVEVVVSITSGKYVNRKRWIRYMLTNPTSKGMLMGTLKKFDIDYSSVEKNEDLGPLVQLMVNKTVAIQIKKGKEKANKPGEFYDNTYINEVINVNVAGLRQEAPQTAVEAAGPKFDSAEEIPF